MRKQIPSSLLALVLVLAGFAAFSNQHNTATATVDTTAPASAATIAKASYGPGSFSLTSTLNGTASDSGSGMSDLTVSVKRSDDNKYWDGTAWGSSENWLTANLTGTGASISWKFNATNINSAGFGDGITYTVTPSATDIAGNSATGTSDSFRWDASPPSLTVTAPMANSNTNSTSLTLTATTNENANCLSKIDSGTFSTMTTTGGTTHSRSYTALTTGSHTVQVKCTDEANNTSAPESRTWTIGNSGTNSNTNSGNSNTNSTTSPALSRSSPASLSSRLARNTRITCRAADTNSVNPGLNANTAKIKVNGVYVTATTTVVTSQNGNNNSTIVKSLDISYQPNSNSYYPADTTVDVDCEIYNNNNLRSKISFAFDVDNSITNENSNSTNGNSNASNSNTNGTTNQNTNTSTGSGSLFFTDTTTHWGKTYVEKLHTACGVDGYKDASGNVLHEFRPDNPITRAELAAMILKCKNTTISAPAIPPFFDVPLTHWAVGHIQAAKESAIVGGYPDGSFQPNRSVLRSEAVKMILLGWFVALDITGGTASFSDVDSKAWYYKYVAFAVLKNFINGLKDTAGNLTGLFGPEKEITRAEAAKVIMNVKGIQ